jgi:chaperonin GroEL
MPNRGIVFNDDARAALSGGVKLIGDIIGGTLGPHGRNVMFGRFGSPRVTNDGDLIADQFAESYENPYENVGLQIVKEAAKRTGDNVGDGTTTSVVLARSIANEGLRNIAAGANPMFLKRGMDRAASVAVEHIRELARPISDSSDVRQVATIASNDEAIGATIADIMDRVGNDGMVLVDDSRTATPLASRFVEGMQLDKGWLSPYFVTNTERMEGVLEEPSILLTDKRISSANDFLPFMEKVMAAGVRNLFIVALDLTGDALALVVLNKLRGVLNTVAIKSPSFGERMKAVLQDLAALTGAQVVADETGVTWDKVPVEWLGSCSRVTVNREASVVLEGGGHDADVEARCDTIRGQIDLIDTDWEREKLEERLARLTGGVGIIEIGAVTEIEQRERKARAEDGVSTTKAAIRDGIVPGGGTALVRAAAAIDLDDHEGDERTGAHLIKVALEGPLRQIAENSGAVPAIVASKIREADDPWFGYDAKNDVYGDLYKLGVVDAAGVTIEALVNAVSAAGMVITTEVVIADISVTPAALPPEQQMAGGGGMGMPDMGGMGGLPGMGGPPEMGGMGGMGGMPGMGGMGGMGM